jgi:hypothetical protein
MPNTRAQLIHARRNAAAFLCTHQCLRFRHVLCSRSVASCVRACVSTASAPRSAEEEIESGAQGRPFRLRDPLAAPLSLALSIPFFHTHPSVADNRIIFVFFFSLLLCFPIRVSHSPHQFSFQRSSLVKMKKDN